MKKTLSIFIALLLVLNVFAQKDPEAKRLLDKVSKTTKSYKSVKIDYEYILENLAANVKESKKGTLLLKGEKYSMKMSGFQIITDGKTVWTYLEDAEEIQISDAELDDSGSLTPQKALVIYEKGYKYKLKSKKKNLAFIDLYPENPGKYNYTMVNLIIDTKKDQLTSITTKGKNGVNYTIKINNMTPNIKVEESTFKMNTDDYDADVIDMRD